MDALFGAHVLSRLSGGSNYHHETSHGIIVSLIWMFGLLKLIVYFYVWIKLMADLG